MEVVENRTHLHRRYFILATRNSEANKKSSKNQGTLASKLKQSSIKWAKEKDLKRGQVVQDAIGSPYDYHE